MTASFVMHARIMFQAVYISHLHADHHIGLVGLLKEREKITQDPLYLFAPQYIAAWLQLYHRRFESILHQMTLISNNEFFMNIHNPAEPKYKDMYQSLNVQAVRTTYVKHCPHSYGISVTLHNGKKIVYRYIHNFFYIFSYSINFLQLHAMNLCFILFKFNLKWIIFTLMQYIGKKR